MTSTLFFAVAVAASHIIGPGGLISPPEPKLTVGYEDERARIPVHGQFAWQYGEGLDSYLTGARLDELVELRQRHVMLSSLTVACGVLGSAFASFSLFLTPAFVSVEHPDPGGLVVPIVMASAGVAIALVSVPLVLFRPGDNEIVTLVAAQNADKDARKVALSRELEDKLLAPLSPPPTKTTPPDGVSDDPDEAAPAPAEADTTDDPLLAP